MLINIINQFPKFLIVLIGIVCIVAIDIAVLKE